MSDAIFSEAREMVNNALNSDLDTAGNR